MQIPEAPYKKIKVNSALLYNETETYLIGFDQLMPSPMPSSKIYKSFRETYILGSNKISCNL